MIATRPGAAPSMPLPQLGLQALHIADDVLADPAAYTAKARASLFATIQFDRTEFHGLAPVIDQELARWIMARFPHARPGVSFYRESPAGQAEPHYIHTDQDMGDWSGILYLTEHPIPGDGTVFWRLRATGQNVSTAMTPAELDVEMAAWHQPELWQEWARVEARPNRLVLFPSELFHSRALFDNYGTGDHARLVQVIFGTGSLARITWP